jgi:hypothetical protein
METSVEPHVETLLKKERHDQHWKELCEKFLPLEIEGSIWRYNRKSRHGEPSQGWKIHVSATVLNACEIFKKTAPFLNSLDVQFKAPASLDELTRLNSGLQFGYSQVGKFITVYPGSAGQAVQLAKKLHQLTGEFVSPVVPFDEQFLPYSCVYYRYGAFRSINRTNSNGDVEPCIRDPHGELVPDDRFRAFPDWLSDPFKDPRSNIKKHSNEKTPLNTNYQVIRALTQRGKGGVYLAIDLSMKMARLCVIKEGRRNGEVNWNGLDGYTLLKNEFRVLTELGKISSDYPKVLSSFEMNGNYYLVMEYTEGESLRDIMKIRRRRFSIPQIVKFSIMLAEIIRKLHRDGWIWTDCKPANLIVTPQGKLRPVDFEGAYRTGSQSISDWRTAEFSLPGELLPKDRPGEAGDLYSLGAVLYFLITGNFFQPKDPVPISKLRQGVPKILRKTVNELIRPRANEKPLSALEVKEVFESLWRNVKAEN